MKQLAGLGLGFGLGSGLGWREWAPSLLGSAYTHRIESQSDKWRVLLHQHQTTLTRLSCPVTHPSLSYSALTSSSSSSSSSSSHSYSYSYSSSSSYSSSPSCWSAIHVRSLKPHCSSSLFHSSSFLAAKSQKFNSTAHHEEQQIEEEEEDEEDEDEQKGTRKKSAKKRKEKANAVKSSSSSSTNASSSYERLTQREHILLRPETYVGSMAKEERYWWTVVSGKKKGKRKAGETIDFELKQLDYRPALFQIVDEILVNAADNTKRNDENHPKMSIIDVAVEVNPRNKSSRETADRDDVLISVLNDGNAIPIEMHDKEKMYIPHLIFGHLLTSSNYDDRSERFTGGRHGFGAKLTNIFSKEFTIDLYDSTSKKFYHQQWKQSMKDCSDPLIVDISSSTSLPTRFPKDWDLKRSFTRISFRPDLQLFGEKSFSSDMMKIIERRVYDLAAFVGKEGVKVNWNEKTVPLKSFKQLVESIYRSARKSNDEEEKEEDEDKQEDEEDSAEEASDASETADDENFVYTSISNEWEVAISPSILSDSLAGHSGAQNCKDLSFVNGIATTRGGTHVNAVADRICRHLADYIRSKEKIQVTPTSIRSHLSIFINALIPNPTFDRQTKDALMTHAKNFSDQLQFSSSFLNQCVKKTGIIDRVVASHEAKQQMELMRRTKAPTRSKILNIPKLDDANLAGTKRGNECTLILTEGDSAKALVLAGLSVVGREKYGVFPLRGKVLNVRDASTKMILNNQELQNLMQILGLKPGEDYKSPESRRTLRYGKVMMMTDQDHDGSHIKGLIINFFHTFYPQLLHSNEFLEEFVTAIVKVSKGKESISFMTIPEFLQWQSSLPLLQLRNWRIKYYKGLGTNTAEEGKQYFRQLEKHRIQFIYSGSNDDKKIEMAFSKQAADQRKSWLAQFKSGTYIDHSKKAISYKEFVDQELILFSMADNIRSIPSVIDGLKPVQRKVLFACFKRNLTKEIKVAQLSGYVSEQTGYHHGEQSLHQTIVKMAQDYVGSNNVPLLVPSGQFGTRNLGGKDAASARYIFTRLAPLTRLIFRSEDDAILTYKDEDGMSVEPEYFLPIIPMALINGAEGIGTGFSTFVPMYHPLQIIQLLKHKIANSSPSSSSSPSLHPCLVGHTGHVTVDSPDRFQSFGVINIIDSQSVKISELPFGVWTEDYKEFLSSLISRDDSIADQSKFAIIKSFREHHSHDRVSFTVTMTENALDAAKQNGLHQSFRLVNSFSTGNMHLFDSSNSIKRYSSLSMILSDFFPIRLHGYHLRRNYLLALWSVNKRRAENKMRFIEEVRANKLVVYKRKKTEIIEEMKQKGYATQMQLDVRFELEERRRKNPETSSFLPNLSSSINSRSESADSVTDAESDADIPAINDKKEDNKSGVSKPDNKYDYLLNLPLSSLTAERMESLQNDISSCQQQVAQLEASDAKSIWMADLQELEQHMLKSNLFSLSAAGENTRTSHNRTDQKQDEEEERENEEEAEETQDNEEEQNEPKRKARRKRRGQTKGKKSNRK